MTKSHDRFILQLFPYWNTWKCWLKFIIKFCSCTQTSTLTTYIGKRMGWTVWEWQFSVACRQRVLPIWAVATLAQAAPPRARGAVQPKSSGPKANFADKHSSHDAMTLSFDPSIPIKSNTPCQKKIKNHENSEATRLEQIQGLFPLGCRSAWRRADTPLPLAGLRGSSESIKSKDMWNPCEIQQPLLNWNKYGFDKVWLRYLAPSYQNASAGTAWKGSFFEVPPRVEKFQCTLHLHVPIGSIWSHSHS